MTLPLDEAALESIEARRAAGDALVVALDGRVRAAHLSNGATIVYPTEAATRATVAAGLRLLAELTARGGRSLVVLAGFESSPEESLDDHDYIGRLVVRLNIGQLVVVGDAGRHIHAAAGLEGSWDGESVIVGTAAEAYDLVRGILQDNDVVLVMGATAAGLDRLSERLVGVAE